MAHYEQIVLFILNNAMKSEHHFQTAYRQIQLFYRDDILKPLVLYTLYMARPTQSTERLKRMLDFDNELLKYQQRMEWNRHMQYLYVSLCCD